MKLDIETLRYLYSLQKESNNNCISLDLELGLVKTEEEELDIFTDIYDYLDAKSQKAIQMNRDIAEMTDIIVDNL